MAEEEKIQLAIKGTLPTKDHTRLIKVAGLGELDDATMLGVLLDIASHLKQNHPTAINAAHEKGRAALRILAERRA
ncbi:MAG: conjugal transfer protein TraD, partial [Rhodospirillales bacterium]|nr:conjugal transfer protein TraD [Rhodospirillales bacterium]